MLKRFRFLVVDDQHGQTGWPRVFGLLKSLHFLPTRDYSHVDDNTPVMAYDVIIPDRSGKSAFSRAVEHLSLQPPAYDFCAIDADLSQSSFVDEHDKVVLGKRYPTNEEGCYLFVLARKSDQLPILFTGKSKAVGSVEKQAFESEDSPGVNVAGQWGHPDFNNKVASQLDRRFLNRQRQILLRQAPEMFLRITDLLQGVRGDLTKREDLLGLVIPDGDDYWTIRTLFPQQSVRVDNASALQDCEQDLRRIEHALMRHQEFVKLFLSHPNTKIATFTDLGGVTNALKMLRQTEFRVGDNVKLTKYRCLSSWPHCRDAEAHGDIRQLGPLREYIINARFGENENGDYLVTCPTCGKQSPIANCFGGVPKDRAGLLKWLVENEGVYPIDLYHLAWIVQSNGQQLGGPPVLEVIKKPDVRGGVVQIEMLWTYPRAANADQFDRAFDKLDNAANKEAPDALTDEGLGDAFRIVVLRYGGALELSTGGLIARRVGCLNGSGPVITIEHPVKPSACVSARFLRN